MKMNRQNRTKSALTFAAAALALATSANAALVYHDITLTNTTNLVAGSSGGGTKWELRPGNSNFFNDNATQSDAGTEDPIVMTITGLAFNATYTDVRIYNRADQGRGASYSYDGSSFTEYVGGTFTDTSNGGIGNDAAPNSQRAWTAAPDFTTDGLGNFSITFRGQSSPLVRSDIDGIAFDTTPIPEPTTTALLGLGGLALLLRRRK